MFCPHAFQVTDETLCHELIRQYALGTLISVSESGVEADHLPFLLTQVKGEYCLQSHIARSNPLWKNVTEKASVLVTFQGPQHYISPQYYATKQATGKAVPTWNYAVVHARGNIAFVHDPLWLRQVLEALTAVHEQTQAHPWSLADAPPAYIEKMLSAIVGIQIPIASLEGKWKLSQNQPEKNRLGVIQGLTRENTPAALQMAAWIKQQDR